MPLAKFAPDKIQTDMFLPLMKIALMGVQGGRCKNKHLFRYNQVFCHPFLSVMP
jgi:hypothetical protein